MSIRSVIDHLEKLDHDITNLKSNLDKLEEFQVFMRSKKIHNLVSLIYLQLINTFNQTTIFYFNFKFDKEGDLNDLFDNIELDVDSVMKFHEDFMKSINKKN